MAAKKAKQKKRSGFVTFLTVFSVIIILGVVIYAASNLYVLKSAEPYIMASEDASSRGLHSRAWLQGKRRRTVADAAAPP